MAAVTLADRITADADILGGKPVITGTRIAVELILAQLGRGLSLDEVARNYTLTKDDVLAAIRFAAGSLARDSYITPAR